MPSLTAGKMPNLLAIAKLQYSKSNQDVDSKSADVQGLYDPRQGRQVSRDASGFSEVSGVNLDVYTWQARPLAGHLRVAIIFDDINFIRVLIIEYWW